MIVTGMPTLTRLMVMPPPMVPAPMTAAFSILRVGVSSGTSGILEVWRSAKNMWRSAFRFVAFHQARKSAALFLPALVERQVHRGFHAGHDFERRGIAARGFRHFGFGRFEERLGIAIHFDAEVADAARALAFGHEFFRKRERPFQQIALHDFVDQTQLQTFFGRHRVAGCHHLHCFGRTDNARQALGAARAGQDAELHFRQAQQRLGQRDAVVAAERELEAPAEREAANRGDHRLFERVLRLVDFGQGRGHRRFRRVEFADVRAAREGLGRADDHQGFDRRIGFRLLHPVDDTGTQHAAQAVHGRVVHDDDGDAVAYRIGCCVTHGVSGMECCRAI